MSLFDAAGELHVQAQAREVFDVTGAGDTVIATLATHGRRPACRCAKRCRWPTGRRHRGRQVRHGHGLVRGALRRLRAPPASETPHAIVVTGAAGFIGSNIVKGLNARGIDDIIAVDDLTQGDKFRNLADLRIDDYLDLDEFYERLRRRRVRQGRGRVPRGRLQRHDGAGRQVHDGQQLRAVVLAVRVLPAARHPAAVRVVRRDLRRLGDVPRDARVRAAAERLRLLQAAVRPAHAARVRRRLPAHQAPGRGLPLLQRVRPARAAQGPHGQRGLPPVQPVPRAGQGASCSASTAAMRPASSGATSSSSTTWWP